MRGIMDFEITGEETQEQLSALLDKVMDVEVSDEPKDALTGNDQEGLFSTEGGGNNAEQVQNTTGDKQAPTPGAGTEEEGQPQEEVKGILARDGKHVIPYDIPCPLTVQADRQECVIMRMIIKTILFHFCAWRSALFHAVPSPVYENVY